MAVPWAQIIRWAPQIISVSRELLQRTRRTAPAELIRAPDGSDVAHRVAALEENERRQAELVERMAEQQASLARAVLALHKRLRILIGALIVLGAVLAWVLWRLI